MAATITNPTTAGRTLGARLGKSEAEIDEAILASYAAVLDREARDAANPALQTQVWLPTRRQ